ncbi:MAG TPA: hypothetical protein PL196_00100 [Burkholderiaceae bacterium]|nr:hypothetical protein [Burkholderiaceae bacterium]
MSGARVEDNLSQFVGSVVPQRAAAGMTRALIIGAAEASVRTPIDTSTLLNSQFRLVRAEGSRIIGTVGYTANYAVPVHDPNVRQTFRRSSATKEFLTRGMESAEPQMRAALAGSMKT